MKEQMLLETVLGVGNRLGNAIVELRAAREALFEADLVDRALALDAPISQTCLIRQRLASMMLVTSVC